MLSSTPLSTDFFSANTINWLKNNCLVDKPSLFLNEKGQWLCGFTRFIGKCSSLETEL
ncbi:hypothetical protein CFOL_v3_06172 [Cephalotus follicularis]|uniref:Uncharacterized protein n=1 Tax=Cephalotus follicularis TaxID=3775 RepID=A0A1Q3B3Y0_CEPFO|nr:hypothetical protein CFOL_v3_06172 [Cephalotus follicularis]